jgi:hypothetical protein
MRQSPALAFILNFLLPGLGLWYLRKWRKGFINLGVVLALGVVLSFFTGVAPLWLATFISISSGAWAYLEALELRVKRP